MFKALVRTGILVVAVLGSARFVPFIAEHETLLLVVAVLFGLAAFLGKLLLAALLAVAVAAFFFFPGIWYSIFP